MQNDRRELIIRTDSRYVQLGATRWLTKWKKRAFYAQPLRAQKVDNVDLWMRLDKILEERGQTVKSEWGKGHALPFHISAGLTTEKDIWGNTGADWSAGEAARKVETGQEEVSPTPAQKLTGEWGQ